MKEIILSKGYVALVDDEDFENLNIYKWTYTHGYARRDTGTGINRKRIYLHRAIMGNTGIQIDHINGNRLDCRKSNLRFCTNLQNQYNRGTNKNGTSKYKGVCWITKQNRWRAQIKQSSKNFYIGNFVNEIDAALAYDIKAKELFGDFAKLNFKQ